MESKFYEMAKMFTKEMEFYNPGLPRYTSKDVQDDIEKLKDLFSDKNIIETYPITFLESIKIEPVSDQKDVVKNQLEIFEKNNMYYIQISNNIKNNVDIICSLIKKSSPKVGKNKAAISEYICNTFECEIYEELKFKRGYGFDDSYRKANSTMFKFQSKEKALEAMDWIKFNLIAIKLELVK